MELSKVAETLHTLQAELIKARDGEIMQADECLSSYITDHNDRSAWRAKDKQVAALVKAWDRMIVKLENWIGEAERIENSVGSFYGD